MIVLPQHLFARLLENGIAALAADRDPVPVVKFFDPCGAATWFLTEALPADPDILFGLCDVGMACPELGHVRFSELAEVRNRLGLGLERDLYFHARFPLSVYAQAARERGRITEDETLLMRSAAVLGVPLPPDPTDSPAGE